MDGRVAGALIDALASQIQRAANLDIVWQTFSAKANIFIGDMRAPMNAGQAVSNLFAVSSSMCSLKHY